MDTIIDSDLRRTYRISSFLVDERTRFIVQHKETFEPSISMSVYEQYLSLKRGSHNSVKDILDKLTYFFTWADDAKVDIETMLLNGLAPTPQQVRTFVYWLGERVSYEGRQANRIAPTTFNRIIEACSAMFTWFIMQYSVFNGAGNQHQVNREKVVESVKGLFKKNRKKVRQSKFADDLSEEEIATIEAYLKPSNRTDVDKDTAMRDYLVWRLAIEFGLRIGEILALRLKDCPYGKKNDISIVRIEERGRDYVDPRGANRPQPKTLSRDLGFLFANSPLPRLISDYISDNRCQYVIRAGKKKTLPITDHTFLIVNHWRKDGRPLSGSGMQRIAEKISRNTGIKFHWHIARHAFFNRTYQAVASNPDYKDGMMDLVYWGGWADEKSLQLYVNRARRERATKVLMFWQKGLTWDALK